MTEHDDVRRPSAPADAETGYPGQGLGRPQDGPGSIPSLIRRVGGLCIDWGIAVALAAALLLAADVAVRLIVPDRDLKLGVLTAIVGAPLFLHLIWKTRSGGRV